MEKPNVAIVSAVRTPFDVFGGVMKDVPSIDLGEAVLRGVVEKVNFPKEKVEYIFYGTTIHAEIAPYTNIPVRQALLHAGFPAATLSLTVDRACCSSMTAVMLAYREIQSGEIEVAIAGGAENLSNVPYMVSGARWGKRLGDLKMYDLMADLGYIGWAPVAVDTDNVAKRYDVSREEQDQWAYGSQQKYKNAFEQGKFKEEIIPCKGKGSKNQEIIVETDQAPRPETTYEKIASLKTVYGTAAITAGNSPGLNAGASAILLMTEKKAEEYGLEIIGYIRDIAAAASDAENIPTVPADVIKRLIGRNNLGLEDIDLIEINEAFAAMPVVSTKILADGNQELLEKLRSITNVNGGAVAIGHPMGATGTRLIMTLMYELRRRGGGTGIACLCGGLAQGDGVLLEVKQVKK